MSYDNEETISPMVIIALFSLLELFFYPFIALSFVYIFLRNKKRHFDATGSLEINTLFYSQKKSTHTTTKKTLLEREYGGGSMFEFQTKMTVVKKTVIFSYFFCYF